MIPLYKLERLSRNQKLRKIAKIFTMAENRLCLYIEAKTSVEKSVPEKTAIEKAANIYTEDEFVFFKDAAKLFAYDIYFPSEAAGVFEEAANVFENGLQAVVTNKSGLPAHLIPDVRRALNNVKHILLAETGCDQADWDFTCAGSGRLDSAKRQVFEGMQVYLEDIRSPFNVGAMFRTAESFGVEKIFLSPFCADPYHKRAERTAMGCIDIVPWRRQNFFTQTKPPSLPCPVFALETGGVPINEFAFPRCGLLIAGSEELGVSPRALAAADASLGRVSIPIYGAKASLNVSTAFGIALNAWAQALV